MNFILHTAWTVRPIYGAGEKGSDLLRASPLLRLEQELLGLASPLLHEGSPVKAVPQASCGPGFRSVCFPCV